MKESLFENHCGFVIRRRITGLGVAKWELVWCPRVEIIQRLGGLAEILEQFADRNARQMGLLALLQPLLQAAAGGQLHFNNEAIAVNPVSMRRQEKWMLDPF